MNPEINVGFAAERYATGVTPGIYLVMLGRQRSHAVGADSPLDDDRIRTRAAARAEPVALLLSPASASWVV